jgi:DNA-binding response OmpR family regulator
MLNDENISVDWVQQGDTAYEYASHGAYEVIVLDWMMPGQSGIEVCKRLRKEGYQGSILLLTAKDSVDDKVLGLETGADDYVVKPFDFIELLARIRALGRRGSVQFRDELITIGDLVVNRSAKTVQRDGREIQLTGREFQLLDLLVQNRGQVLPKEIIIDRIWGLEAEVASNNLEAFIRLLRRKLHLPGERILIQNIRGVGYKLEV